MHAPRPEEPSCASAPSPPPLPRHPPPPAPPESRLAGIRALAHDDDERPSREDLTYGETIFTAAPVRCRASCAVAAVGEDRYPAGLLIDLRRPLRVPHRSDHPGARAARARRRRRPRRRRPHPGPPVQQLRLARALAHDPRQDQEGQPRPLQRPSTARAARTSCSATTAPTGSSAAAARTSCGATGRAARPADQPARPHLRRPRQRLHLRLPRPQRDLRRAGQRRDLGALRPRLRRLRARPRHLPRRQDPPEGLQVPQLREGRLPQRGRSAAATG